MTPENATALKAVYYDQTVAMLREMIANERKWAEESAGAVVETLGSDALYPYAFMRAEDTFRRAARLNVLESVLSAMTRNLDASGMSAGTAETQSGSGLQPASPTREAGDAQKEGQ